jgi:hypothetical protein
VRAIRRSAACPLVPPIPACSATPAASATRRGYRHLVETRRCRQLPTDRSDRHLRAWQRSTRARRSASSAQIRLTQEGRRSAGAVGHRSEGLRGFARAVSASRTDARFWKTSRRDPGRGCLLRCPSGCVIEIEPVIHDADFRTQREAKRHRRRASQPNRELQAFGTAESNLCELQNAPGRGLAL